MQVTKSIKIDLVEKGVQPVVHAKQNDRQTRFIAASLFTNGQPFSVPDGVIAMFRAGKPDGTACFYDSNETGTPAITIAGNLVTVELAEQVLTSPGNVQAEINFYTAGGEKLTSFSFAIQVEKSVLTDQEIVSSNYYNVLTEQVKAAQDAAQSAQTSAGQAEQALQEVEQMINNASGAIQQAGQEQIAAVQQAGAQQTAAAAAEADRAQGYAESINPAQFVKTVNGTGPDASGNVEVQTGASSADDIEETASRVFVSPQEKVKWNDIPGENLVINGGMQIWQRGESLTEVGTDTYTADRLIMYETVAGKFTVEKYNDPEMGLCAKITCTTAGWINLGTVLELTGIFPSMTGSFYAKCSRDFSNHIVISPTIYDDETKSQNIILSTNWKRYSFTVSDITTSGLLYFTCLRGSGVQVGDVFYLTRLKIEEGSEATQYVSRTYAEELNMCRRYYKFLNRFQSSVNEYYTAGKQVAVKLNGLNMRVIPTVSLKGTPNQTTAGGYYIGSADGGGIIPNMTFSVNPLSVDMVQIRATFGGNQTASMNYIINFTLGTGIAIDAEIY